MNAFDATDEQIDKIHEYLTKKYPLTDKHSSYGYGVNCACAHCPYGFSNDGYGRVWDCLAGYSRSELSEELEEVINGNRI